MDNLSPQMKARLEKWRQSTGKAPEVAEMKKKLTGKAWDLDQYRQNEQDYWDLELETERLKRQK